MSLGADLIANPTYAFRRNFWLIFISKVNTYIIVLRKVDGWFSQREDCIIGAQPLSKAMYHSGFCGRHMLTVKFNLKHSSQKWATEFQRWA